MIDSIVSAWISPIKGFTPESLTTGFGVPAAMGGEIHDGQDFAAGEGTPIYAPADGIVKRSFWNDGGGNMLEINHAGGILTGYAHAKSFIVKAGQSVKQGQLIGYVGQTGSLVTGSHLHFYTERNGRKFDPLDIFSFDGETPAAIYQDLIGDVLDSLRESTKEDIGQRTWAEYANNPNTDFGPLGGLNFAREQVQGAIAELGWGSRTIQEGDLKLVAQAITAVEAPKAPWDIAAEAAGTIAEVVGAVATFAFNPLNWARLLAMIAGGILAYSGFRSMWEGASA